MVTMRGANMSTTPAAPEPDDVNEVPGDMNAADIVAPTGEEMPTQTHDEPDDSPAGRPSADPARPLHQESPSRRPVDGHSKGIG